ncbi:hypothetical protein ACOMHN_029650 [Nucella lapillus]
MNDLLSLDPEESNAFHLPGTLKHDGKSQGESMLDVGMGPMTVGLSPGVSVGATGVSVGGAASGQLMQVRKLFFVTF